ncbi:MAG: hypothetical protein QME94_12015 [Anaerolineae bacterium]|nr:hypothetical protein [Anaerolineae bacterium]
MDFYNFVILLSPSVLIICALLFVTVMRYISYKERVALVERGVEIDVLYRSQGFGSQGNRGVLWAGTITATCGLGLLLGLWSVGQGVWLLAGFVPLCVGLGMLGIYHVTRGPAAQARPPEALASQEDECAAPPADSSAQSSV